MIFFAALSGRRKSAPGAEALGRRLSLRPPCSKLLPFSPGRPGLTVVRHVLARDGGLWLGRFSALALCPLCRYPGAFWCGCRDAFGVFEVVSHHLHCVCRLLDNEMGVNFLYRAYLVYRCEIILPGIISIKKELYL